MSHVISYCVGEELPARLLDGQAKVEVIQVGEVGDPANGWTIPRWQERRTADCGCVAKVEYDAKSTTSTRVILCDSCSDRFLEDERRSRANPT